LPAAAHRGGIVTSRQRRPATTRRTVGDHMSAVSCPPVATDNRLTPGDAAPDFSLTSDTGETVSLADHRGRRVIVYFYPAAGTPGCTKEACDFTENLTTFNDAGIDVVGISPDKPAKLAKFRADQGLTFPLLSDPDKTAMQAYGAWGEKTMYGRTSMGVIRSTFLVDAEGKIEDAQYGVKATGHVGRLLRDLKL
jgi:thioredoxin-dependent peroxiredoxin